MTAAALAARRAAVAASPHLQALRGRLVERAGPLLRQPPPVPDAKALLSVDGGVCPVCGARLAFDPWSAEAHRCPRCGEARRGERHSRHWARYQHLWLAERAAHLAALAALGDDGPAGARAAELLAEYGARYFRYPNRDNVLGPSRLFFSTYLESLWVCRYLAAAQLLRAAGRLDDAVARAVTQVADEAANLIGEYDERFSNRQTWNDAALAAIAAWFDDAELLGRAVEGPTGLVAHLLEGFRADGMWYEGENYHLFALRGVLEGIAWARVSGLDLVSEPALATRLGAALRAPALTALPDLTFPARKDAPFGVSLAQPGHLESWEVGRAWLGKDAAGLEAWLTALYRLPSARVELMEWHLDHAPADAATWTPRRDDLSWWALLEADPEPPDPDAAWGSTTVLLADQGLAVLRAGDRYASLECGPWGGGHGHPDRLHLTLHAGGVHWLPDFGTGSYVSPDLFWYRSTLSHNAPRLDGRSQPPSRASCERFDERDGWAWVRGRWGGVARTLVAGPRYLVDVVELTGREERLLELPWHFAGTASAATSGAWRPATLEDEFVTDAESFAPAGDEPVALRLRDGARTLVVRWAGAVQLLRASGPGAPDAGRRRVFHLVRARGANMRIVTVLEPGETAGVRAVRVSGDVIEIETAAGTDRHRDAGGEWAIEAGDGRCTLRGKQAAPPQFEPWLELDAPAPATGVAFRVAAPPALDGSPGGFDVAEPLRLDLEDQYRRSEEPYPGADEFSAAAYAAWDEGALYVAVDVTKPDRCFRPPGAPPLLLDNEPDDIHSDGLQVYLRAVEESSGAASGWLMVPEEGGSAVRVRGVGTAGPDDAARAAWRPREGGYRVTLALPWPAGYRPYPGGRVGFDLIVNEMLPGRTRRAGQLVWSGGDGWVWLRGDRQDPARMGVLELVG